TSWLPVWYVYTALTQAGIQTTWDGNNLNMTAPSTMQVDLSNLPTSGNVDSGTMAVQINGQTVLYCPRMVATDPASGQPTTYVPIYYLELAVKRFGITPGWDATNWTMTQGTAQATKLAAALSFFNLVKGTQMVVGSPPPNTFGYPPQTKTVTADPSGTNPYSDVPAEDWPAIHELVEMGLFKTDSDTSFGANDPVTEEMLDHAYQIYCGIQDEHLDWNPGGGTPIGWANVYKLNDGVPTDGNLTLADMQKWFSNMENCQRGYSVNNGVYQLWFKPYDGYGYYSVTGFANNSGYSATDVAKGMTDTITMMDALTFTLSPTPGQGPNRPTLLWKVPGMSAKAPTVYYIADGLSTSAIPKAWSSLDGGKTWVTDTDIIGYGSDNPVNGGGSDNPPPVVLVKTVGQTLVHTAENFNGNHLDATSFANARLTFDNNGNLQVATGAWGVDGLPGQ
ncbi:MAG: S-layer homology domain-containing protein, partial [Alicyclobacillus sp.]|nr:S-layer homology domain-containing protein [Alicyclobacillus sp.]